MKRISVICLLNMLLCIPGRVSSQYLVCYYNFDNSVNDQCAYSGYNNGIIYGDPVFSSTYKQSGSHSLYFDGEDDRVEISKPFDNIQNEFSIEFYFMSNNYRPGTYMFINRAHMRDVVISLPYANTVNFSLRGTDGVAHEVFVNKTLLNGQWYHVQALYNGSVMTLKVDDTVVQSSTFTVDVSWSENYYRTEIGHDSYDGADKAFIGYIDELRIYDLDISLPVMLFDFQASCNGPAVCLTWLTMSEVDHIGFIIERSDNMMDTWQCIASYEKYKSLRSLGNHSDYRRYTYIDREIQSGSFYYYRLLGVDMEGTITPYKEVPIKTNDFPENIQLSPPYPNPSNSSTTFAYTLDNDMHVNVTVFDLQGREITVLRKGIECAGGHTVQWDGTDCYGKVVASGMYLVRLITSSRGMTRKFVVQR